MTQYRKRKGSKGQRAFPLRVWKPDSLRIKTTELKNIAQQWVNTNPDIIQFDDWNEVLDSGNTIAGIFTTKRGAKYYGRFFYYPNRADILVARSKYTTSRTDVNSITGHYMGGLIKGITLDTIHPEDYGVTPRKMNPWDVK